MIYSTNRKESLGDLTISANESYFGFGSLNFIQECAEDELSIFEAAIKSDIEEHGLIKEGSDLTSLNESFVEKAKNQIKTMMEKFLQWIQSTMASVMKKFDTEVGNHAAKYAKSAKEKFAKLEGTLVFKGKAFDPKTTDPLKGFNGDVLESLKNAESLVVGETVSEQDLKTIQEMLSKIKEGSKKDFLKDTLKEFENGDVKKIFDTHIEILEGCKDTINPFRVSLKEVKDTATKLYKEAKKAAKGSEDKEAAARKVQAVAAYRDLCTKTLSMGMQLIRTVISTAKSVVDSILRQNTKAVKEGTEEDFDVELLTAMGESFDYELEQSFEEISEGEDCCDDDKDDDIESDDDSDED